MQNWDFGPFSRNDVMADSQKSPTYIIIIIMTTVYHFYSKPLKSQDTL